MRSIVLSLFLLQLLGCAPAVMTKSTWSGLVDAQRTRLERSPSCCTELVDLKFDPLPEGKADFRFSEVLQMVSQGGVRVPAAAIQLETAATVGRELEIFSYSERKTGFMKLDRMLFIRPNIVFLDSAKRPITLIEDPPMCWGSKDSSGGAWLRTNIPAGSRYLVIYPSIAKPSQAIDTRMVGPIAPGIALIADARKSYSGEIQFGLEGLVGVELVSVGRGPRGRCVTE